MSSLSLGGATFTSHLSPRPLSLRPQWLRTLCGLPVSPDHPQTLQEGELALLVEPRRHHKPRLIKLDSSKHTETSIGRLHHSEAVGREVGVQAHTTLGGRVTVRKPSLEEYTLLMSRGATPSYCSVIYTALCMLDIGSGSKVIEAGTGSGAMTLHLSRIGAHTHTLSHLSKNTKCSISAMPLFKFQDFSSLAIQHKDSSSPGAVCWKDGLGFTYIAHD